MALRVLALLTPALATDCKCAYTAANKHSCCAKADSQGQDTGDFCGSWYSENHCNGSTPVCCTSKWSSQCCPANSACSAGCFGGGGGEQSWGCKCQALPVPSSQDAEYNETVAKAFAHLAQAAYCTDMTSLVLWNCDECKLAGFTLRPFSMELLQPGDGYSRDDNMVAYIAKMDRVEGHPKGPYWHNACVIGFRGISLGDTADEYNKHFKFINESRMIPWPREKCDEWGSCSSTDCEGCAVHEGFRKIWERFRPGPHGLLAKLKEMGCNDNGAVVGNNPIYVTGHGLGAGVAQIAMYSLKEQNFMVSQSYLFNAPRVGNEKWYFEWLNDMTPLRMVAWSPEPSFSVPLWRVTHGRDRFAMSPDRVHGYRHVGSEAYYYPSWPGSLDKVICARPEDIACGLRYGTKYADRRSFEDSHCKTELLENGNFCEPDPKMCKVSAATHEQTII